VSKHVGSAQAGLRVHVVTVTVGLEKTYTAVTINVADVAGPSGLTYSGSTLTLGVADSVNSVPTFRHGPARSRRCAGLLTVAAQRHRGQLLHLAELVASRAVV
jgi:hypothetical protein